MLDSLINKTVSKIMRKSLLIIDEYKLESLWPRKYTRQ